MRECTVGSRTSVLQYINSTFLKYRRKEEGDIHKQTKAGAAQQTGKHTSFTPTITSSSSSSVHSETGMKAGLWASVSEGDIPKLRTLLDMGLVGAPLVKNHQGWTLLHEAVAQGRAQQEMVALLCTTAAVDVNAQKKNGLTASHVAAKMGDWEALRLLAAHGADFGIADHNGQSAHGKVHLVFSFVFCLMYWLDRSCCSVRV